MRDDELGELHRQLFPRQKPDKGHGAGNDKKEGCGEDGSLSQDLVKFGPSETFINKGLYEHGVDHRDGSRLGGGEYACVNPSKDNDRHGESP